MVLFYPDHINLLQLSNDYDDYDDDDNDDDDDDDGERRIRLL